MGHGPSGLKEESTSVQTTIRLPVELKEALKREAKERGYAMKDLVVFILQKFLDQ